MELEGKLHVHIKKRYKNGKNYCLSFSDKAPSLFLNQQMYIVANVLFQMLIVIKCFMYCVL